MEFDNSFEVPLPPAEAWPVLMDIKRIAPCMPGADLALVGLVALTFAGTVRFEEIDNANHSARVKAQGTDAKGRGGANAAVSFRVEPVANGSKVLVHTDLALSGSVAQYGRGVGMIQATAAQIINQFAGNLKAQLAAAPVATASPDATTSAAPPAAKPISGFSLMTKVLWDAIVRLFGRRAQ